MVHDNNSLCLVTTFPIASLKQQQQQHSMIFENSYLTTISTFSFGCNCYSSTIVVRLGDAIRRAWLFVVGIILAMRSLAAELYSVGDRPAASNI